MKKYIFTLGILSTFAFTNKSDNLSKNNSSVNNLNNKIPCTISCSTTIDGVTYSATAGNWFSSCERAARRCGNKLVDSFEY